MTNDLPMGWRLQEFGSLLDGGTRNGVYKAKQFRDSGVKMVNMGELFKYPRLSDVPMSRIQLTKSELEKSSLSVGDLLFARRSLVADGAGKCSIVAEVKEPTTFESSIIRARPDSTMVDSRFLYYFFNSPLGSYQLGTILRHVAVAGITGGDLVKLQIPVPPLPEQRAIADVLSALDDKIELNHRMNQTLEQLAQTIFQHMFIDNPESGSWKIGSLSDLCQIAIGGDWGSDTSMGDDQPVICLRGVDLEHLRKEGYSPNAPLRWVKNPSLAKRKMTDCDVLIAGSGIGPVGRPIWVSNSMLRVYDHEIIYSNFCKRLTAKTPGYALFIDRVLHNLHQSKEILDFVNGTSLPNLDINGLVNKYQLIIPPENFINKYFEIVVPFYSILYSRQSQTLAELRDTLLPKLMSGQLRVIQEGLL